MSRPASGDTDVLLAKTHLHLPLLASFKPAHFKSLSK